MVRQSQLWRASPLLDGTACRLSRLGLARLLQPFDPPFGDFPLCRCLLRRYCSSLSPEIGLSVSLLFGLSFPLRASLCSRRPRLSPPFPAPLLLSSAIFSAHSPLGQAPGCFFPTMRLLCSATFATLGFPGYHGYLPRLHSSTYFGSLTASGGVVSFTFECPL